RIELEVKEQHLSDGVTSALEPSELGPVLTLEVSVIRGKPFEKVDALVRAQLARFERETPAEGEVTIARQIAELAVVRERDRMLDRAFKLAWRACQATACFEPSLQMTAATFTHRERLDLRRAVVVEHRFSGLASPEGDVQSTVVGAAP